jgi:hypothetical protein
MNESQMRLPENQKNSDLFSVNCAVKRLNLYGSNGQQGKKY